MGITILDYLVVLSMILIAYTSAKRRKFVRRLIPDKTGEISGEKDFEK